MEDRHLLEQETRFRIHFDRVTSEALNDRAVWDTLTGGTNFSERTISTVAQLSSLFGGFGRPGYDAALDDGGFISIIGPDDLPLTYFELPSQTISGDYTGSVTDGGAPGDDNTGTLTAVSVIRSRLYPKKPLIARARARAHTA